MSLVNVFVDAFKKAAGRKPEVDTKELVRNEAGLGVSAGTDAFDPIERPAPSAPPPGGTPVQYPGDALTDDPTASAEEFGSPLPEPDAPPTVRSQYEDVRGPAMESRSEALPAAVPETNIASSEPEEGGEVLPPGLKVEGAPGAALETSIASSDPEEGGEFPRGLGLSKDNPPGGEGFKPKGPEVEGDVASRLDDQRKVTGATATGAKGEEPLKPEVHSGEDSTQDDRVLHPLADGRDRPPSAPQPEDDGPGEGGLRLPFVDTRGEDMEPSSTLVDLGPKVSAGMQKGLSSPDDAFDLELDGPDLDDDLDDVEA